MLKNAKFIFIAIISCMNYTNTIHITTSRIVNTRLPHAACLQNTITFKFSRDNEILFSSLTKKLESKIENNRKAALKYFSQLPKEFIHSKPVLNALYTTEDYYYNHEHEELYSREELIEMLSNDLREIKAKQEEYFGDGHKALREDLTYGELKNMLLLQIIPGCWLLTAKELFDFCVTTKKCFKNNDSKKQYIITILLLIGWIANKIDNNFLDEKSLERHESNLNKLKSIKYKIELLLMNYINELKEINPESNCSLLEKNIMQNVKIALWIMAYCKMPIFKNIIITKGLSCKISESYFILNKRLGQELTREYNNKFIMPTDKTIFLLEQKHAHKI
jgi:hypothetical protein